MAVLQVPVGRRSWPTSSGGGHHRRQDRDRRAAHAAAAGCRGLTAVPRRRRRCRMTVEEFLTWLAVERGRSINTLTAYRRDLHGYVRWLTAAGRTLETVAEPTSSEYVATLRADGPGAGVGGPGPGGGAHASPVPGRRGRPGPTRPPTSPRPGCRRGCPSRSTRTRCVTLLDAVDRLRAAAAARPGHPGAAVRHRHADLRAVRAVARRRRTGDSRAGAGLRQGRQGAHRAARAGRPAPPWPTG